jgi:ATP-dependent protease ClpP protease subunit
MCALCPNLRQVGHWKSALNAKQAVEYGLIDEILAKPAKEAKTKK